MKIRNGFVSNSSSSSFIIGIAKVPDEKYEEIKNKYPSNIYEYGSERPWEVDERDGTSSVESFMYSNVKVVDCKPGDHILYLYGTGPDDDSWFEDDDGDDGWGDLNYDKIEFDDFNTEDQDLAGLIGELDGEYTYGAGRNG